MSTRASEFSVALPDLLSHLCSGGWPHCPLPPLTQPPRGPSASVSCHDAHFVLSFPTGLAVVPQLCPGHPSCSVRVSVSLGPLTPCHSYPKTQAPDLRSALSPSRAGPAASGLAHPSHLCSGGFTGSPDC